MQAKVTKDIAMNFRFFKLFSQCTCWRLACNQLISLQDVSPDTATIQFDTPGYHCRECRNCGNPVFRAKRILF
jgi:hypothetical protein